MTTSGWSISVNTWIPTPEDDQVRLMEALVRYQVALVYKQIKEEKVRKYVLNPNEDDLGDNPLEDLNKLVELTVDNAAKDASQTNCDEFNKIRFVGNVEKLKPVTIQIPSEREEDGVTYKSLISDDPSIRMINILTDKNVISEAAKVLLNSKCNKSF